VPPRPEPPGGLDRDDEQRSLFLLSERPAARTVTGQAGAATAANDTIREAGGALVGSLAHAQTQPNPIAAPAGLQ
jgi:hypothetical protein